MIDPTSPLHKTRSGFETKQHVRNVVLNHASGALMIGLCAELDISLIPPLFLYYTVSKTAKYVLNKYEQNINKTVTFYVHPIVYLVYR